MEFLIAFFWMSTIPAQQMFHLNHVSEKILNYTAKYNFKYKYKIAYRFELKINNQLFF